MPMADQLLGMQQEYVQRLAGLWNDFFTHPERTTAPISDPRFSDPTWQKNSLASFYARAYLLNAEFLNRLAESVQGDKKLRKRVKFAVSQWVDAASPANYLRTQSEGAADAAGHQRREPEGRARQPAGGHRARAISMTDESAFEVGKNVATTEGAVVFENELFQLIQYAPLTEKVYERPLLIVPPCINKFYILDLQPENSFVRFAWRAGPRRCSWCPGATRTQTRGQITWDDYVEQGAMKAIEVAHGDQRRRQGQRAGLVRRRHHALVGAGRDARARRRSRSPA